MMENAGRALADLATGSGLQPRGHSSAKRATVVAGSPRRGASRTEGGGRRRAPGRARSGRGASTPAPHRRAHGAPGFRPQPAGLVVDALLGYSGRGTRKGEPPLILGEQVRSGACALDIEQARCDDGHGAFLCAGHGDADARDAEERCAAPKTSSVSSTTPTSRCPPIGYERLGVRADPPFREVP
jgi:hypothetical protein